ncbi:hypothetical protein B0H16DRAFT_1206577, partial [Mycena metata]
NAPPTPSTNTGSKRAELGDRPASSSTRRKPHSDAEKIQAVLASIREQGWTLGEFLYKTFDHQGRDSSRSQPHAQVVKAFLGGHGRHIPSDILTCWMMSPDG